MKSELPAQHILFQVPLSVALNTERRWKVSYVKELSVGGSNLFHPTNCTSL
jgi:hypothetical protein